MNSTPAANAWLQRLHRNMQNFKLKRHEMTLEQQVEFLRDQYTALSALKKIISGDARFEGSPRL